MLFGAKHCIRGKKMFSSKYRVYGYKKNAEFNVDFKNINLL
jgi:hypothetical protein